MVPSMRVGGVFVILVTLTVVAVFGSAHLYAAAKPNTRASKVIIGLGF